MRSFLVFCCGLLPVLFLSSCVHRRAADATPVTQPLADAHPADEFFRGKRWQGPGPLPANRYAAARSRLRERAVSLGSWEPLGPANVAGRTKTLVIDPTAPNTMYAATAEGGIWKTVTTGQSWFPLTDSLPVLAMSSLAIDPTSPNTLYAGSGEQLPGAGIFKTLDGGQSWTQLPQTAGFVYVFSIAISPSRPTHIYAATDSGLWATFDGGATWTKSLPSSGGCYSTVVRGDQPIDEVFATCSQTNGYPLVQLQVEIWNFPPGGNYAIYRGEMIPDRPGSATNRKGPRPPDNWEQVFTTANMGPTALAIAPSAPDTIYALATNDDPKSPYNMALLGLYASDHGGVRGSWELRANTSDPNSITANMLSYFSQPSNCANGVAALRTGQGGWNLGLAVDPTNSQTIFAAGVGLTRSQDGGRTFAGIVSSAHTDMHGWAIHPGYNGTTNQTVFATNDGGVFMATNGLTQSASFTCSQPFYSFSGSTLINNLQVTQFYHGAVTAGGGLFMGGSQDTSTQLGSATATSHWTNIYGGDGGMPAFDPLDPNTMYFEYQGLQIARSIDGGNTYVKSITGISEPAADFPFVTYYVLDPNHSQTLYIGGYQLWRSTDGAQSWNAASPNTGAPISAIAVNPADSSQVIYGDNSGAIYTGSIGALTGAAANTWTSSQPRSGYVSDIVFDAAHPSLVYATYATFGSQPSDAQLYTSHDGGNTWSPLSAAGLPDIPLHVLLIDPDVASTLYLGTDVGLFVSSDSGATWARDTSFPAIVTESLQMDKNGATKYLYAFTYGRGAWRVNLTPGAPPCTYTVSPATFSMTGTSGSLYPINVTTAPGCAWSASAANSLPYVRLQSPSGGIGPGTLYFSVGVNYSGATRFMQIYIQDQTVNIQQTAISSASTVFDELFGASTIAGLPYYRAGSFNLLTSNSSDPAHSCTGSKDLSTGWFMYSPLVNQRLDATAVLGGVPGVLTAYPMRSGALGAEIACVTNSSNAAANPSLIFDVTAGNTYAIEIGGVGQPLGSIGRVTFELRALPSVTVTGGSTSLPAGQGTRFTASVTGSPNTAVRWSAQYGVIDRNGNYMPPPSLMPGQTIMDTVTATSFADSNASANVQVSVSR